MIPKRISGVRIRRSWVGRLVAVGALGCAMTVPVGSVRAYSAVLPLPSSTSTTPAIPTTPVSIPLSLQALEQKMGELKVTSLRFSEKTSVTVPHGEGKVLSLLTSACLEPGLRLTSQLPYRAGDVAEALVAQSRHADSRRAKSVEAGGE